MRRFFLAKYIKASRNEAELKKLYIEENDERNAVILQSASSLSMVMIFVGLGIASMIAGFFNAVIFYTLLAALLFS
ncbi:hypothetical protein ACFQ3J_07630 [Paenibacillus provencensis]|uniref:Uncharacterized protein n=1 Tax=Paenibacillus provencensis TaxID=441151 RepID=A0ABW3PWK9_9BACL|nr:hypothetical protein [Paenibacillus sp. MER 78]MCM3129583.1 hypothetical protein [Paenibacillus sp. MER 78]